MNSQRSAPLSRATAERSAFHDVASSRSVPRTSEIERARGGAGGLSVSSGEPPAHATVGAIPLPGTRSGKIAGSEVRANKNEEARATLAKRGRDAISASPFRRSRRGIAPTSAIPLRRRGKGAVPHRPHTTIRISEADALEQWEAVNFLASDPEFWSRPLAESLPSGPGAREAGWKTFATPVIGL